MGVRICLLFYLECHINSRLSDCGAGAGHNGSYGFPLWGKLSPQVTDEGEPSEHFPLIRRVPRHFFSPPRGRLSPAGWGWVKKDKSGFVKEIYNMKKVCLAVLPALTIVLELLPLGAVCIFATSPTERVKETFSYFSLTPFGYANFAPLITATLTVAIFLLSLFSLKKKGVLKALFVLSIITVVISLLPLMYGLNYYTLVGAFITVTLVIESVLAKIQQK